jgi:hypothetical protein
MGAVDVLRAVVIAGAPLTGVEQCVWCESYPDDRSFDLEEAGGPPPYEQAEWHTPECAWRQAVELWERLSDRWRREEDGDIWTGSEGRNGQK